MYLVTNPEKKNNFFIILNEYKVLDQKPIVLVFLDFNIKKKFKLRYFLINIIFCFFNVFLC